MALAYPSHPSKISSKPQIIETNGTKPPQLAQHSRLSLTYTSNGLRQAALTRLGAAPMMLFGPLRCSRWDENFLSDQCRPAREPKLVPALASPSPPPGGAQWDPKPGRAAPTLSAGPQKPSHTAFAEVHSFFRIPFRP